LIQETTMPPLTLSDDQKDTINKIHDWSQTLGLDPSFALAVAYPESNAKHIPADDPDSTAFGPFQVNKATAQANGINYDEMKKNKDLAIWAGLKNLQRHSENPLFEGDPSRILAAHRFGEGSPYAKTGDPEHITPQLANFFSSVGSVYGDDLPKSIYEPKEPYGNESQTGQNIAQQNAAAAPAAPEDTDSKVLERLVGGTTATALGLGVGKQAINLASPVVNSISQMRAANALKKLQESKIQEALLEVLNNKKGNAETTGVNPNQDEALTKKSGIRRWVEGRTNVPVPDALLENVTTLKGHGKTSASNAEARLTAGAEKSLDVGEPLSKWSPNAGGTVLVDQSPPTAGARSYPPTPVQQQFNQPGIGAEVGQGVVGGKNPAPKALTPSYMDALQAFKNRAITAAEPAAAFLRHPLTAVSGGLFGVGAMGPEILEAMRTEKPASDVAKTMAQGAAYGVAPALLPSVIQAGLRYVAPPLAALAHEYDAYKRRKTDPMGAAISGVGGLSALAPLVMAPTPATLAVGATGALAPHY
jgi:hypothetical protein